MRRVIAEAAIESDPLALRHVALMLQADKVHCVPHGPVAFG
jgi:hypothetical protein